MNLTGPSLPGLLLGGRMNNPEIPEVLDLVIGLGAPLAISRSGIGIAGAAWSFPFLFLAGAVLVILLGIYEPYQANPQHGPSMIDDTLAGPAGDCLRPVCIGMLAGWITYVNWNKGVVVYERGFAYSDRKGLQIWRWEEVASMTSAITRHYTNGIYPVQPIVYTLYQSPESHAWSCPIRSARLSNWRKDIDENIFPLLYEPAADQYNPGQTLIFGPVTISKTGITIGKKTYPWRMSRRSPSTRAFEGFQKEGGWFSGASAAVSAIPNLRVLLAIIHQVVGVRQFEAVPKFTLYSLLNQRKKGSLQSCPLDDLVR